MRRKSAKPQERDRESEVVRGTEREKESERRVARARAHTLRRSQKKHTFLKTAITAQTTRCMIIMISTIIVIMGTVRARACVCCARTHAQFQPADNTHTHRERQTQSDKKTHTHTPRHGPGLGLSLWFVYQD